MGQAAVPCPPGCGLVCSVPGAWWQSPTRGAPPAWSVAYAFTGLSPRMGQHPLRPDEYAAAVEFFAARFGLPVAVEGIRHAASIPSMGGSHDPERLAALADRLAAGKAVRAA